MEQERNEVEERTVPRLPPEAGACGCRALRHNAQDVYK